MHCSVSNTLYSYTCGNINDLEPVSVLSDEQVLVLTELQMEAEQDARLSEMLDRQQSGTLSEGDHSELQTLMQVYQEGLLRKATALSEASRQTWVDSTLKLVSKIH
ncbi:hypothetical protein [Nostoc sp. FACHB-888]|uniref:hypothetical protein n=1 Tax=Nostoc sp. FACHB-888 TaxID=2692842 RepID=UPI001F551ABD|nr:hypothetical protein [Nostoc sp. FACHB-888]